VHFHPAEEKIHASTVYADDVTGQTENSRKHSQDGSENTANRKENCQALGRKFEHMSESVKLSRYINTNI
jgi:hypothetical protein